jgi:antiviral helicase SKI2
VLVLCPEGYTPPAPAEEKADEAKSTRDSGAMFDSQYGRLEAVSSAQSSSRRGNSLTVGSFGVADGRTWFFTHATGEDIVLVSARKRKVAAEEVLEGDARSIAATVHMLEEYERASDLPGVDAVRDYKLNELDFVNSFLNAQGLHVQVLSSPFYRSPKLVPQYALAEKIGRLQQAIAYLRYVLSSQSLTLFPDFQQRLSILHRLGYADPATNTVGLKGRVACEINTCEELIATELIFENVLEPLNPPEAVAILSALVFQEKGHEPEPLTARMEEAKQRLIDITMGLGQLQFEAGLPTNAQDYCKHLNFGLAHVVYLWATKAPFASISELTTAPAGSIVRCITSLDELCRDVRNAARVIGNPSLYRKMEDASLAIRRDIVFAASLYIK